MSYCANCGISLDPDVMFCQSCGNPVRVSPPPVVPSPPQARPAPIPSPVVQSRPASPPAPMPTAAPPANPAYCPACGAMNVPGSVFCNSCGTRITAPLFQPAAAPQTGHPVAQPAASSNETSWAYWLLPILFLGLGGIVACAAVMSRNKGKAIGLFILGIVMSILALLAKNASL